MNILRHKSSRSHDMDVGLLSAKNRRAFTLVELIVTVIILGILATIAFINFSSYPRQARDAVRITNVEGIEEAIEFYKIKDGDYPLPSNYSTGEIVGLEGEWYIGEFGDDVANKIDELQEKPQDPNTKQSYYYALSHNRKNYRIIAKLEATGEEYVVANKVVCAENYSNSDGRCLAATQDFTDYKGEGEKTWNGNSWETNYTSCTAPYIQEGSTCKSNPNAPGKMILVYGNLVEGDVIKLPFNGVVNLDSVNCGEGGTWDQVKNGLTMCTYGTGVKGGETTIVIEGKATGYGQCCDYLSEKLLRVEAWENMGLTDLYYAFFGATRLKKVPDYLPETVTSTSGMFSRATSFNQDLDSWDTSNVTNMSSMFSRAESFNGKIGNWDMSNVENVKNMFNRAKSFNQSIGNWNITKVKYITSLFFEAESFNQPLNNWDTSSITDVSHMFEGAISFNQDLYSWDTSNVKKLQQLFMNARKFNKNIGNWDTSNVEIMGHVFNGAESFNQPLNNWDTSNVIDIRGLFKNTKSFNQPLNNWDTSSVRDMGYMFENAESFNQFIGNWDTSNVTDMGYMFNGAKNFNQSLANWDTSKVTGMGRMFYNATSFNKNLSCWNVSLVTYHSNFSLYSGMSYISSPRFGTNGSSGTCD